ncbi:TetR/AcrR family transcriptional regulator [Photobacterium sp. 1_MG-2023]|uniref:TetR/AcrR family transcriptional regulator n=1 Tax=Photobacterium sp. 1_MG-2023 TaxID=3062646 RepID=UPI0026E1CEDD|nr:TetR/AcrR family transcriptional regulator [Photobacterium sp. 1_MG-2023]MDO6705581.1 TetR/AcrR family transcriptional regulator [Photobacterium sp. 1_MG-2023]
MSRIREKNQEVIIKYAGRLFAEQGFAATKVADIAKLADVPKPNVYYYFKTKENLYRAVLESVTEPLLEASKPIEDLDDPAQALTSYIHTKLRISRDHPFASKVFANEVMSGAPYLPEDIREELLAQSRMIISKLERWIEKGVMARVSPQHLMFTIWASTQTYADFSWQICNVLEKEALDDQDFANAAEFLTQLVIQGCKIQTA